MPATSLAGRLMKGRSGQSASDEPTGDEISQNG